MLAEVFSRCEKVPVLSIIACRILEDELTRVLSLDHTLRHLFLVDNLDGMGLSRKLRAQNRAHLLVAMEEIPDRLKDIQKGNFNFGKIIKLLLNRFHFDLGRESGNAGEQELVVVVNVLKMALHSDGKLLKDEVYKNIRDMSRFSNGILLFYGLCGNSLGNIGIDLRELGCPIYFLTDKDDKQVDDCIAVALGGNKQYEETLSGFPGVGIFFTPMWAFNWREIDKEVSKSSKSQNLGSMLNSLGYQRVARLDTGLHYISDFEVESKISEFASSYSLEIVGLQGNTEIADRCYRQAKDEIFSK
jgi:hypothetical protein